MSHGAKQIRDWFKAACTGVAGLPACAEGTPRQIEVGTDACFVRTTSSVVERITEHEPPIDAHDLTVEVVVVGNTFTEADGLSVLAEEAIADEPAFPGDSFDFVQREYEENTDTDRAYVSVTLTYVAKFSVARNDVETLT